MSSGGSRSACALIAIAGCFTTAPAWARDEFPGKVAALFGSKCVPPCNLCHISPLGGGPFHPNVPAGLIAVATLPAGQSSAAIETLKTTNADNDADSDYQELVNSTDPLDPTNTRICPPEYGCSWVPRTRYEGSAEARDVAARATHSYACWFSVAGALAWFHYRRRRFASESAPVERLQRH